MANAIRTGIFHNPPEHRAGGVRKRTAMPVSPVKVPREACEMTGLKGLAKERVNLHFEPFS